MIHIVKQKTGYMVVSLAKNGEVLSTSEVLKSKQACWKNIKAQMIDCFYKGVDEILVQDDTPKEPKVFAIYYNRLNRVWNKYQRFIMTSEPYIPGKNPPRKNKAKAKRG